MGRDDVARVATAAGILEDGGAGADAASLAMDGAVRLGVSAKAQWGPSVTDSCGNISGLGFAIVVP